MDAEQAGATNTETGTEQPRGGMPGDGAGQREDVGRTNVYPVSSMEGASGDATIQGEQSWGQSDRGAAGYEDHGESESITMPPDTAPGAGSGS